MSKLGQEIKKVKDNPYVPPTHDKCANKKCKNTCSDLSARFRVEEDDGTMHETCSMMCGLSVRKEFINKKPKK